MPFNYPMLNFLQLNVLFGQVLTYFLLYSLEYGVGTDYGINISLLLIQALLAASFVILLCIFLLPGLKEDVLPALLKIRSSGAQVRVVPKDQTVTNGKNGKVDQDDGNRHA